MRFVRQPDKSGTQKIKYSLIKDEPELAKTFFLSAS